MNLYSFVIGQVGIHGFNLGDKTVAAWINPVKPENLKTHHYNFFLIPPASLSAVRISKSTSSASGKLP